jgi:hypothetical protein
MKIRTNWILSAVVVVLLAYIGYTEWRSRRAPEPEVETLGAFDPAKVDEVSVTVAGRTATAVREGDGRWTVVQPFTDEADGPTIVSLLENLRDVRVVRTLEAPDDLEQYGLGRPRVIAVSERGRLGRTTHRFHLGEISPVHYTCPLDYWIYARREGEPRVLVVEGYQIDHLMPREPEQLRNQNLLSFDPNEVQRVEVTVPGASYAAVRTAAGWQVEGAAHPDPPYMRQIVFTLANLRAVRYGAPGDEQLGGLGLDRPAAQVALYTDRAEPVERLTFGATALDDGTVAVRRDSTHQVYQVSNFILGELRRAATPAAPRADPARAAPG